MPRKPKNTLSFILARTEHDIQLFTEPPNADYRLFAGAERAVLREYQSQRSRQAEGFDWGLHAKEGGLRFPDDRLLDAAADALLLYDEDFAPIEKALGTHRVALCFNETAGRYQSALRLELPSGEIENADGLIPVGPRRCILKRTLYAIEDLGPDWMSLVSMASLVAQADLAEYLSIMLSRFTGLSIRVPGYQLRQGPVRKAVKGIMFTQLDAYGYLHIRPVSVVESYRPGFFEDFEATKVVHIKPEEGTITASDVIFPEDAVASFQRVLESKLPKAERGYIQQSGRFILAPDCAARFIEHAIVQLVSEFALFQSERLASYKIRVLKPKLKIRTTATNIDYFEASAHVDVQGQEYTIGQFLAEHRKSGCIALADGSKAFIAKNHLHRLERLIVSRKDSSELVELSVFDVAALQALDTELDAAGPAWEQAAAFYDGYNTIQAQPDRHALAASELRQYQAYGAAWMEYLLSSGFGACLADDMGLGKTVQAIAVLRAAYAESNTNSASNNTPKKRGRPPKKPTTTQEAQPGETRRSLIVAPKTLIYNWVREIERFAPELQPYVHHGTQRVTSFNPNTSIILTTYATLRNDIELFAPLPFEFIIIDEAQAIKNADTKTSAALRMLRANKRVALSGTPIENSVDELYSLFGFLSPTLFGSRASFIKRYKTPIEEHHDEEAIRELRTKIKPFILRRLKRDVLPELPPKTEQLAFVELDEDHLREYHRRRQELKTFIDTMSAQEPQRALFYTLSALSELRKLASVPEADEGLSLALPDFVSVKRRFIQEQVTDLVSNGHKALIFTNYLARVEHITNDLSALGIGTLAITGSTDDRNTIVHRFQTEPEIQVLVMTLKTGGLGLNLTAADYVFIADPWWNAAAEAQAIDRTHRIGQENPVFCYRIIARDTIEEKIIELQRRKTKLADALIDSDASFVKLLSEEDLSYLLG